MSQFFSKVMLSSVVLGSLASAMLVEPAAARKMNSCQIKHSMCVERCVINSDSSSAGHACISRTCDRQHAGCGGESFDDVGGGGPRGKGKRG